MGKLVVKELSNKYGEDEKVIRILIEISFQEGFPLKKTKALLKKFYSKNK